MSQKKKNIFSVQAYCCPYCGYLCENEKKVSDRREECWKLIVGYFIQVGMIIETVRENDKGPFEVKAIEVSREASIRRMRFVCKRLNKTAHGFKGRLVTFPAHVIKGQVAVE